MPVPYRPLALAGTAPASLSFSANWIPGDGGPSPDGFLLDVSTSSSFSTFVGSYHNLDVSYVLMKRVTGLSANTQYYYRVRAYNIAGNSAYSGTRSITTASSANRGDMTGLVGWFVGDSLAARFPSGGNITDWFDDSPNGNRLLNTSSFPPDPIFAPDVINGHNVARFSGASGMKLGTDVPVGLPGAGADFTVFVVAKSGAASLQMALTEWGSFDGGGRLLEIDAAGKVEIDQSNVAVVEHGTTVVPLDRFSVLSATYSDAAGSIVQYNGAAEGTNASAQTWVDADGLYIGSKKNALNFIGDIAEVLWFDHKLSGTDFLAVATELLADYPPAAPALPAVSCQPVLWTDFINTRADASTNTLKAWAGIPYGEWAGGAGSVQGIPIHSEGYVEFTARTNGQTVAMGLRNGIPSGQNYDMPFAWEVTGAGTCFVLENGGSPFSTTYSDGDTLQIAVIGGLIQYFINGAFQFASLHAPLFPLMANAAIRRVGGTIEGATICGSALQNVRPVPPYIGQDYTGNQNRPAGLRVIAAIGSSLELTDITNGTESEVVRQSMRIERSNEASANAIASFDLALPNRTFDDIPANRQIFIDDPQTPNGLGGWQAYFAGYTMQPTPSDLADGTRQINIRCVDYGILLTKPPKQITTQWPPGDGTPVVNARVGTSISAGVNTITPTSMRHIYVGKRLIVQNSDGSNKETVVVTAVTSTTFTATFASSKTSSTTTVAGALHATGPQTITPASMTNITVGSLLYCLKHHGVQTVGNEYVVVTGVTGSTFDATFLYWKTHDWEVQNQWLVLGGVSDKELIADGFKMHLDTVDPTTGVVTTTLVDIPSLLDYCYNEADPVPLSVDKSGVTEVIPSLPHGKWVGATPADVLKWVALQNPDNTKQPRYYMTFAQPTSTAPSTLLPKLRYYDALAPEHTAAYMLTNQIAQIDSTYQARWKDAYSYPEDGIGFANKLTVIGALGAQGSWQDSDSIFNPSAANYAGKVIEATPVTDTTFTTNADCDLRAADLAAQQKLSTRQKSVTVTTNAQLDPRVLYEPQLVEFNAVFEPDDDVTLEVRRVALSFESDDLAKYAFTLGLPQNPQRAYEGSIPVTYKQASVRVGKNGKVSTAGPKTTQYIYEHTQLTDTADSYVADTSDGAISLYLPKAADYPGLPVQIHVPPGAPNNATIYPFQRQDVLDTVDGANSLDVAPGQSVLLQSAGEHDVRGHGALWHVMANAADATGTPWLVSGNAQGADASMGTQDAFDQIWIANNVEQGRLTPDGVSTTTALRMTGLAATPTIPAAGYARLYPKTDGQLYLLAPDGIERLLSDHPSVNLPIATGAIPTTGLYAPVLITFPATIVGVRVRLYDATGAAVSDSATVNIKRVDWSTDTLVTLNPSAFGPSSAVKFADTTLTSWTKTLAVYDSLQVELASAPATAVAISVALEVVPV